MRRLLLFALLALGAAACEQPAPVVPAPQDAQLEPVIGAGSHGSPVVPLPDPEVQSGRVGRSARRLTVKQLGTSIQTAVGRPWTKLEDLAASLGRADYALVNAESTEPNLVFAKFLSDGAHEVCMIQAEAEKNMLVPSDRILGRTLPPGALADLRRLSDGQVRELLVYLSTRFWGAPLQGEELTRWVGFFTKAAERAEAAGTGKRYHAMGALCINLMTDSRFLTY